MLQCEQMILSKLKIMIVAQRLLTEVLVHNMRIERAKTLIGEARFKVY